MTALIYATLGNTTNDMYTIESMIREGMKGVRINTAYCGIKEYDRWINFVQTATTKLGVHVPVMLDLKGPQLRLELPTKDTAYQIEKGSVIDIGSLFDTEDVVDIALNQDLRAYLEIGDSLLIENGTIRTKVIGIGTHLQVEIVEPGAGLITNFMGVNVPGRYFPVEHLTAKDHEMLRYAIDKKLDFVALSFVRDTIDLEYFQQKIQEMQEEMGAPGVPKIVAKIEDSIGVRNLDAIVEKAHNLNASIMLGRGDLYTEMEPVVMGKIQQQAADACRRKNVPYFIATGFLEGMKYNTQPTRTEVGDVWNALRDRPYALVLTAETSNGINSITTVSTLQHIISKYT